MKRFLFSILLCGLLTCITVDANAQKSKSFFYDGIELHNVKGWNIMPAKDATTTVITGYRLPLQLNITKVAVSPEQGVSQSRSLEIYLEKFVDQTVENIMSGSSKITVKEVSPIMDGYVNTTPAKYVDITYNKNVAQRIYAMLLHNSLFTVVCTGVGKSHDKMIDGSFGKILSSFTYIPESSSHRLF